MAKKKRGNCQDCGRALLGSEGPERCATCQVRVAEAGSGHPRSYWSRDTLIVKSLANILDRGDGWVRIVMGSDGDAFLKFKFTSGPHQGKYILTVVPGTRDPLMGLVQLETFLEQVDAGSRRPSPDIPY